MPAWLLSVALLGAPEPGAWTPAEAPPPTPWALAGARGWRLCQEAERQARAVRDGNGRGTAFDGDEGLWRRRAEQCPHAVEVLTIAAQGEIIGASRLFSRVDVAGDERFGAPSEPMSLDDAITRHREMVEQGLQWLEAAIEEAGRRGERPPRQALYFRAYALAALGRIEPAREAIEAVVVAQDVERWRSARMSALIELQAGRIHAALRLAQRGVVDAPPDDQAISRYIRAFVLDRAGAPDVARAELIMLRNPSSFAARDAMESVLPFHEWLFFRALDHQANGERSPALRLWEAYLARPEPAEPERVLARRRLDELTPSPAPVGGP